MINLITMSIATVTCILVLLKNYICYSKKEKVASVDHRRELLIAYQNLWEHIDARKALREAFASKLAELKLQQRINLTNRYNIPIDTPGFLVRDILHEDKERNLTADEVEEILDKAGLV